MSHSTFISRKTMLDSIPILDAEHHAVISCNDTLHGEQEMREKLTCPSLILFFQDTDNKEDPFSFSLAQAIDVVKFVQEHKDKYIIVHCHAGISRSAAISRWIELFLSNTLPGNLKHYVMYNKHVFRLLEEAEKLITC